MGKCKYCGENVGLFKKEHQECKEKFLSGKKKIIDKVKSAVFERIDMGAFEQEIGQITKNSYINDEDLRLCLIKGWEEAIEGEMTQGLLTERHEKLSDEFVQYFELEQKELNKNGLVEKAVQSLTINELKNGRLVTRFNINEPFPLGLEDGEVIVWFFLDVNFFVGLTNNIAVFDGKPYQAIDPPESVKNYDKFPRNSVKSRESIHLDNGSLSFTNKILFFQGDEHVFNLKLREIVFISRYDNGIDIQYKSMVNSPLLFQTNEGWFTYELIKGLKALNSEITKE